MTVKKKPQRLAKRMTADQLAAAKRSTENKASKKRDPVAEKRLDRVMSNDLVKVQPGESKMQLDKEPISVTTHEGLMDYKVEGTHLRLLAMVDPSATPTLEQRIAMAQRLAEVGPFLPRYIKSVELRGKAVKKPEPDSTKEDLKEVKEKFGLTDLAHQPKPSEKAITKRAPGESLPERAPRAEPIANGVPLKKICSEVDIDPKDARRALRSAKIDKPGGRWEWPKEDVDRIKQVLIKERDDLLKKEVT